MSEVIFLFITFCGLVGIILRKNFLNTISSFVQFLLGMVIMINRAPLEHSSEPRFDLYLIILFMIGLVLFSYSLVILMIRRRSTLKINELTELRG